MNTLVSFPITKLLKEKEYKDKNMLGTVRLSEPKYYDPNGIVHSIKDAFEEKDYKIEDCFNAPTIADVVMWLYEKHGIWILVDWMSRIKPFNSGFYSHLRGTTKPLNQDNFISINNTKMPGYEVFNSPTEAYEAAILYTLNNLI